MSLGLDFLMCRAMVMMLSLLDCRGVKGEVSWECVLLFPHSYRHVSSAVSGLSMLCVVSHLTRSNCKELEPLFICGSASILPVVPKAIHTCASQPGPPRYLASGLLFLHLSWCDLDHVAQSWAAPIRGDVSSAFRAGQTIPFIRKNL